ncbi:MaoC family dehydratase N-terminal domain-containing protein [Rhodococcus sp. ABRD24]|uniref:FAS1-like dehydratase domain-containing protein n=1 Tax=Rhodococcus sp. ABRD24 TaxID=2507582 RepID=UPI001F61D972|nr:MaoC family dehydratase N-terminal domain-containing protein [Rhodococcus sp. ABRD24]
MVSLSPDLPGRVFRTRDTYVVGQEKVREFARAVLAMDSVHHDVVAARAAGYRNIVVPTTFTALLLAEVVNDLLAVLGMGISLESQVVLHTTEKLTFSRHIVAGDELMTTLTVVGVTERGGAAFVNTQAEIRHVDGELCATVTSSILLADRDETPGPDSVSAAALSMSANSAPEPGGSKV